MVGWGVVGTGRVAALTASAISRSPGSRVQAVLSRDPGRGQAFAGNHEDAAVVTDIAKLTARPDVDVVYVASPNGLHVEHAVAAARAGKHVLCEKPLALTVSEGERIVEACLAADVVLAVAFQYRFHPAVAAVRSIVRSGDLGPVALADAVICLPPMDTPAWYDDASLATGGVLPMSGVHRLDLLCHVLDATPLEVGAQLTTRAAGRPFDDTAVVTLHLPGGALATVRCVMDVPAGGDQLVVHGSGGSMSARDVTSQWWGGGGGALEVRIGGEARTESYGPQDLYAAQVQAMEVAIRGEQTVLATGADGLRALLLQASALTSARTGRRVPVSDPSHRGAHP